MVLEVAEIEVVTGKESNFEAAVRQAKPLFLRAKGCRGIKLHRSIENPHQYRLFVSWETLEDHTVDFRSSQDFLEWRKLVSGFFAAPPRVDHQTEIALD
jgi:heme-degrading monooxygenase HmoA